MDIAWIRGQMPGLKHGAYLNTAGIGLSPVSVNKTVAEGYQQLRSGCVSTSDWYTAMRAAEDELPAKIAAFFGADAGEIALTMSTGEGYGMVLGGPQPIAAEAGPKAESLRERLDAIPGVRIIGSRRAETRTCIVALSIEGMDGNEVSDALRNRWQIAQRATNINEPSGVRISVAFYTSDSELDTLVEAVTTMAGERGNR